MGSVNGMKKMRLICTLTEIRRCSKTLLNLDANGPVQLHPETRRTLQTALRLLKVELEKNGQVVVDD